MPLLQTLPLATNTALLNNMKPRSKRNRKRPRSNVNGLNEDLIHETTVRKLELNGKPIAGAHKWLKLIKPYPYTYSTFAKARWVGRTILDVYSTEFGSYPISYYETAIRQGRILVSDKKVTPSYIVKGGDALCHTVHRHEPGVAVQSNIEPYIDIISETDELVIVSKPGTMPVHPCGGYNMQSVMSILEKHYKNKTSEKGNSFKKLYTIHRLDRLTSGLVVLGKTSSVAQSYSRSIMNRSCRKIYLARVAGKFPLKYSPSNKLTPELVSAVGIPLLGEWEEGIFIGEDRKSVKCRQSDANASGKLNSLTVSQLRKKNALACWIEDQNGNLVYDDEKDDSASIFQQVFHCRHSVDDWLESVDLNIEGKGGTDKLWFHLACPTRIAKHKDGICEASSFDRLDDDLYTKSVKAAHSSFGVVSYDHKTDSTLLICRPYTGRTHQIRLHLQHLEHPIANDPNYGGDIWYGNPYGKRASEIANKRLNSFKNGDKHFFDTEAGNVLSRTNEKKTKVDAEDIQCKTVIPTIDVPATEGEIREGVAEAVQGKEESIHSFIERTCVWCARCRSVPSTDRDILEFIIRSPGIWLHALRYSFPFSSASNDDSVHGGKELFKSFGTNLPEWHDMRGTFGNDACQVGEILML